MRLVDADRLKRNAYRSSDFGHSMIVDVQDIDNEETVDAVHVVRCKDCKYHAYTYFLNGHTVLDCGKFNVLDTDPEFYCAYGERKDGEQDVVD